MVCLSGLCAAGHPRQRRNFYRRQGAFTHGNGISTCHCTRVLPLYLQLAAAVLSPLPYHQCGHDERQRCPVEQPTSRRASPSSPQASRASGKIFTARRCLNPRKWHFRTRHPPATARRCTLSPCSSPWRFSPPPSRSHRVGMEGRHSVDQAHVEVRPAELRSARLRSAELRVPQLRRPKLQRQLSRRGGGITSVFSMATKPHDAQLRRTL